MTKAAKKQVVLERVYDAPIEDVWEMWTTKAGIESWWGPDGFDVTVQQLDLRPGGELRYSMNARKADMIAFMKQNGMPLSQPCTITFREITPPRRLAYTNLVDFVPGMRAYDVETVVELSAVAGGTKLMLTLDAMHDDTWTQRATMGWEQELGKLGQALTTAR